jgi:menaquinone-dependent protoporphyrinogen oxidase
VTDITAAARGRRVGYFVPGCEPERLVKAHARRWKAGGDEMRVLIVHASRYGATQGIAEHIGATLRQHAVDVTVKPVQDADDLVDYDAVVIGSATYYFHWMKPAREFVRRNRALLAERQVWLFSSGPLGTEAKDDQGRDMRAVTEPKEIAEFRESIHARGHRVFFGAFDPTKVGFTHRLMRKVFGKRGEKLFPEGDFRDWNDVEAWASEIAEALKASDAAAAIFHEHELVV